MTPELELKIKELPDSPGCYLMRAQGEIIYVGKAKNLKNRVRSYFQASRGHGPKVSAMVSKIDDFDIMLCSTNLEALILECNLIKRHMPYYNILLKDDKHYPYIRIDMKAPFPRVELVRRMEKDGAKYFGPYIGATVVREVMDVMRQIFPVRTCAQTIQPGKPRRPCIHYEMGQCLGPCAGHADEKACHALMERVIAFLNGQDGPVLALLQGQMREAASSFAYERAAILRDRIQAVERLTERQRAISTRGGEQDVLAVAQDGMDAMVQLLTIREGHMVGGEHYLLERAGDEAPGDVLAQFITQYYEDASMLPREVFAQALPEDMDMLEALLSETRGGKVHLHVPQRGDKKELVRLALKNAEDALKKRNAQKQTQYARTLGAAASLGQVLGLDAAPRRIEGFDISNTQGALSVASMVVMIDGKAANKQYRHFRIKTVEGANDFASMAEVLGRRFRHGLEERAERLAAGLDPMEGKFSDLPDLILIDGGPEQLRFALAAMRAAGGDVPMFSLAERNEEIFLPGRDEPIILERHDPALHLIQRLRDEAHRFAITHHRTLRGKQGVRSQLEDIPGVGPARRKALLTHFRTVEALKAASVETLLEAPGINRPAAEAVYAYFHPLHSGK